MIYTCTVSGDPAQEYEYAVVSLSPEYVAWIKQWMALARILKQANDSFYGLELFDYHVSYYKTLPDDYEVEESGHFAGPFPDVDGEMWMEVFGEEMRTAASTIVITDDSVVWRTNHKHSSGTLETDTLHREALDDIEQELR